MSDNHDKDALDRLDKRLQSAKRERIDPTLVEDSKDAKKDNALGLAFRVGVELVSAVVVGTAIGWGLDYWLDTRPWIMLVFIIIGGAAGIMNVYRMARGFGYAPGYEIDNTDAANDDRSGKT